MSSLRKLVTGNAHVVLAPWRFAVLLTLWLIVLYAARVAAFPGASDDDAEALFYTQTLALGYKPTQPPLYFWLVMAAEQVVGVGIAAVEAVKFLCLWAMTLFLFAAGRLVLDDGRLAALAAFSVFGLFYVGWDTVMNYSHSVLLATAVAASLFCVLRLERFGGIGAYVALGVALGVGFLAKYNFALFVVPFAAAALADPGLRPRLLSRRMLVALAIAIALPLPHWIWLAVHPLGVLNTGAWKPGDGTVLGGLFSVVTSALLFVLPLAAVAAACMPGAFRPLRDAADGPEGQRRRRLFERYAAGVFGLIVAIVVAFTVTKVRVHWMMVLVPMPIYLVLRARATAVDGRGYERLAAVLTLGALVILAGVGVRALTAPMICRKCNFFVPYETLARDLRADGFHGGTIVATDYPNQLAGNLRRFFPDSRFISTRDQRFLPPPRPGHGDACLAIWNPSRDGSEREALDLAAHVLHTPVPPPGQRDVRTISAPIPRAGGRRIELAYVWLDCG